MKKKEDTSEEVYQMCRRLEPKIADLVNEELINAGVDRDYKYFLPLYLFLCTTFMASIVRLLPKKQWSKFLDEQLALVKEHTMLVAKEKCDKDK